MNSENKGITTRLLVFAPHPSVGGGVVNFVDMLTRCLSDNIHADTFIVGRRPGSLARITRVLVPIYDAIRLIGVLSSRRHDIYHVNPSLDPRSIMRDALFLIILRAFRRKNTIVFIHGWIDAYYQRIAANSWNRSLFRFAFGAACGTFVLTTEFADKLAALGIRRETIEVTTTMFDGRLFEGIQSDRSDNKVNVIFMSRFVATKGIYELLEAFAKVFESNHRVRLILAGDGPESAPMKEWCRSKGIDGVVDFPGYVGGADKARLLVDSDIFVLPSYSEGCPISLLEALGAGLPVIVTPVGAIPDIVMNGDNGIVIDSADSLHIADAIAYLAEDAGSRRRMGQANRDKAWYHYEANRVTERIEKVYRRIQSS